MQRIPERNVVYRPSMVITPQSPPLISPQPVPVYTSDSLLQQNQHLTHLMHSLSDKLDHTTAEFSSQNHQLEQAQQQVTHLLAEKQALQTDVDVVQQELQDMKQELKDMANKYLAELHAEKKQARAIQDHNDRLQARQSLLEHQADRHKSQEQEDHRLREQQHQELERLSNNLNTMTQLCDRQQAELKVGQQKEDLLREELKQQRVEVSRQAEQIKALSLQTKRDQGLLEQSQRQVVSTAALLEQERNNLQQNMYQWKTKEEQTNKETLILVEEVERVQAELQKRMSVSQDLQVYQAQHSFLLLEVNKLNQTIFQLENQVEELQSSHRQNKEPALRAMGLLVLMAAELESLRHRLTPTPF